MFVICYELEGKNNWVVISGKDATDIFVYDLVKEGVNEDNILIFDKDDEIK